MSRKITYTDQLDQLFDVCLREMQEMPDDELLGSESTSAVKDRALKRLERAAAEAGRRRLTIARQEWNRRSAARREVLAEISAAEARAYVARAARDHHHTLAARKLEDMSDEDVLRLYSQLRELEAENQKRAT